MAKWLFAVVLAMALPALATERWTPTAPAFGELTLGRAVELALERSPALKAVRNGVRIAEADALEAGLRPNPVLTLETEGTEPRATRETDNPALWILDRREFTTQLAYEVQTKRRRRLRADAAQILTPPAVCSSMSAGPSSGCCLRNRTGNWLPRSWSRPIRSLH